MNLIFKRANGTEVEAPQSIMDEMIKILIDSNSGAKVVAVRLDNGERVSASVRTVKENGYYLIDRILID